MTMTVEEQIESWRAGSKPGDAVTWEGEDGIIRDFVPGGVWLAFPDGREPTGSRDLWVADWKWEQAMATATYQLRSEDKQRMAEAEKREAARRRRALAMGNGARPINSSAASTSCSTSSTKTASRVIYEGHEWNVDREDGDHLLLSRLVEPRPNRLERREEHMARAAREDCTHIKENT